MLISIQGTKQSIQRIVKDILYYFIYRGSQFKRRESRVLIHLCAYKLIHVFSIHFESVLFGPFTLYPQVDFTRTKDSFLSGSKFFLAQIPTSKISRFLQEQNFKIQNLILWFKIFHRESSTFDLIKLINIPRATRSDQIEAILMYVISLSLL